MVNADDKPDEDPNSTPEHALELSMDDAGPRCPDRNCNKKLRHISGNEYRCLGRTEHRVTLEAGEYRIYDRPRGRGDGGLSM